MAVATGTKASEVCFVPLTLAEWLPELLDGFNRDQTVNGCWRKVDGCWRVEPIAFEEHWSLEDQRIRAEEIRGILDRGGAVWLARDAASKKLLGFGVVDARTFGSRGQYLQLVKLHVCKELRGRGIGRELFARCCQSARELGGEKLYISGSSAIETQAFYAAMGCVDALEISPKLFEKEPCDRHLEFILSGSL